MPRSPALLLLALTLATVIGAETLESALRSRHVPTSQFSDSELAGQITSWAASSDEEPFLLAYYIDDGAGILHGPLHVVRYHPASHDLRRAGFWETKCQGSVLAIGEWHGIVHIDTHLTPSAGCLLLLSPQLALRAALSGWFLGMLGADYAIVQNSEIHFAAVHPLRIAVYDLRRNQLTQVYPPAEDPYRQQFSRALQAHMPGEDWCRIQNAPCDPRDFDAELVGQVAVNEAAKVFGFVAQYDAGGFGAQAGRLVQPLAAVYVYRMHGRRWEHREFPPEGLTNLFGVETVGELVSRKPQAAFAEPAAP